MQKQEFTAKTVDEALAMAASTFATNIAYIQYKLKNNCENKGFFSKLFATKQITIEAWKEQETVSWEETAREEAEKVINKDIIIKYNDCEEKKIVIESNKSLKTEPLIENTQQLNCKSLNLKSDKIEAKTVKTKRVLNNVKRNFSKYEVKKSDDIIERKTNKILISSEQAQKILLEYNKYFLNYFNIDNKTCSINIDENKNCIVKIEKFNIQTVLNLEKLALSYEHVYKRICQKQIGEIEGRLFLTTDVNYEKDDENLKLNALELAEQVKNTGKSVAVLSKTSKERKIIHLALENFAGIYTQSIGVGNNRKLVIFAEKKEITDNKAKFDIKHDNTLRNKKINKLSFKYNNRPFKRNKTDK